MAETEKKSPIQETMQSKPGSEIIEMGKGIEFARVSGSNPFQRPVLTSQAQSQPSAKPSSTTSDTGNNPNQAQSQSE